MVTVFMTGQANLHLLLKTNLYIPTQNATRKVIGMYQACITHPSHLYNKIIPFLVKRLVLDHTMWRERRRATAVPSPQNGRTSA